MTALAYIRCALKRPVITAGLEAIALTNAGRLFPAAAGRGLIFTLHHVRPGSGQAFDPNAHLVVTPEFLDCVIEEAGRLGFEPVALKDLPMRLAEPAGGKRYVAFTLDDGYRDNAEHAAPVFRNHGVPYTIFLTKGFVERSHTIWWKTAEALLNETTAFSFDFGDGPEMVSCETLGEKAAAFSRLAARVEATDEDAFIEALDAAAAVAGIDPMAIVEREVMNAEEIGALARDPLASFGAHTVSHCNLARISDIRLVSEIAESAEAVTGWTGSKARSFAYPYGWEAACGEREARAVAEAGMEIAVTTQPGMLKTAASARPFLLPRVSLNGHYQKKRYVGALMSGVAFR